MSDKTDRIRQRAHEIWEREGKPDGRHEDHWAEASKQIEAEDASGAKPKRKAPAKAAAKPAKAAIESTGPKAKSAKPKPAAKAPAKAEPGSATKPVRTPKSPPKSKA
ncbi:hypothetical protein B2G71_03070 [Novosphingobium sp. PC22D]|uniref:DUF2934 domain-containing protein n=1 Tax=Novosphingobium sp. PC22D TaxID=1962403 RepID=UPI000BEF26AD|nr:DUF2934 domain-containing protein [Novosphingobium sp. PC22D]PEQ14569.1 hypothetical protein B2G71_03070 [Novosphingobium sp. PC22D]